MMTRLKNTATPAVRVLRAGGVDFALHAYRYEHHGGTARASEELGIDEHQVIKTLVMTGGRRRCFMVLMHGDRQVSTKDMARTLNVKAVAPCDPAVALRLTGYRVGGISPLGTRTPLPVYMESSILKLDRIYINGGRRGLLVELAPADLAGLVAPVAVNVAI